MLCNQLLLLRRSRRPMSTKPSARNGSGDCRDSRDASSSCGGVPTRHLRRSRQSRAEGERARPGPDQGRAADPASAAERSGGRNGAVARNPHGRLRGHAGTAAACGGAERQSAGDRGHGIKQRHRLRPLRPGCRDQGRYLQFHPLRPPARPGAFRLAGRGYPRSPTRSLQRADAGNLARADMELSKRGGGCPIGQEPSSSMLRMQPKDIGERSQRVN